MCSVENCELENFKDNDKCILHCEKEDWVVSGLKDEKIEDFYECLENYINNIKSENKNYLDCMFEYKYNEYKFENIIFPKIFNKYYSEEDTSNGPIDGNFLSLLSGGLEIHFINCKFMGIADFFHIQTNNTVLFKNCCFYSLIKFENISFENDFLFNRNKVFKDISFKGSNFESVCDFSKTEFNDTLILQFSTFENYCSFKDCKIFTLNLEDVIFNEKTNFLNLSCSVKNRETARIIKNSFEQQNNIIEANKFYALEMKEREKELKFFKEPFEWLVFKIHGLASNHSQNWILSLFWIINITFLANFFSYEFICDSDVLKSIDRSIFFIGGLLGIGYGITKFKEKYINVSLFVFSIFSYFLYSSLYFEDRNLKEFSNMINPFSIMTKGEDLDFPTMIYKIIIAYLIYQLIISIRQNTRRK